MTGGRGGSKWGVGKLARYAISNITSFTTAPLQIITVLGVLSLVASIVIAIVAICNYSLGLSSDRINVLMVLICLMGGILMIGLGVVGLYLAKVYEQVRGRPRYVINKRVIKNDKK